MDHEKHSKQSMPMKKEMKSEATSKNKKGKKTADMMHGDMQAKPC